MSLRYLSMNQLAELTGIDRRTVKKRLLGMTVHKGSGKGHYYDAYEALPALYRADQGNDLSKEMDVEALRIERAKREKLEIEVGRLRGELLPIESVCKTVEREYAYVRANVRSLPSRLAKTLSLIQDPHEIHVRLTDAIDQALVELTADKNYELQHGDIESARDASDSDSEDSSITEPET